MVAESITWVEPTGTTHPLTDTDTVNVLVGARGRFMPPVDLIRDPVPLGPGSLLRAARVRERPVDLPLLIQAADPSTLRVLMRSVLGWFDPARGDGRLRVVAPDGAARELYCRFQQGLEGDESSGASSPTHAVVVVTLLATDPYWYAVTPAQQSFSLSAPAPWFPIPPLRLNGTTVEGTRTITNLGDVDAMPIWTIVGPANAITLTNTTTGQSLVLGTILLAGETVVIDTRSGERTVVRGTENLYPDLADGSALWWLAPGDNDVLVTMPGASVASSVVLSHVERYRSP